MGTDAFIAKWQGVTASELSTSQSFLIDLCELLAVERPHATPEQDYMFERPITFRHGDGSSSAGRIDLYRRGCFVLEARGLVRWLRPEFQNPGAARAPEQVEMATDAAQDDDTAVDTAPPAVKPQPWPKDAIEQVRAVADVLAASPQPLAIDDIAARFSGRGPWKKRLPQLLDMLVALGRARQHDARYGAERR